MTEIERLITDTLAALEQELRQTQERQETILTDHQQALANHANTLNQLQHQVARLNAQQQESMLHLQRLSAIHESLEPLLMRLNGILRNNMSSL